MALHVPAKVPLAGSVISVILQMITFAILAACLLRRVQSISNWKNLPLAIWLVVIIYADSVLFVFVTSIITRGIGINESKGVCEGGILLCTHPILPFHFHVLPGVLRPTSKTDSEINVRRVDAGLICYMTTKILMYYFLVERAYIIRGSRAPRLKTKLWLFNCLGMLLPYCAVVVLNFVFRIAYIDDNGVCIIGMERIAMLPLIVFDVIVNVYLTLLFIMPLRTLYSYQHGTNRALRTMAFRSFVGSCATLTSSVVNLTILMVLKGEPGWICLMCCNADILFSVVVLHWVTQVDRSSGSSSNRSLGGTGRMASVADAKCGGGDVGTVKSCTRKDSALEESNALEGTMTTEIKATPSRKNREEDEDDTIELCGIQVLTEQMREVHVTHRERDHDARSEVSANEARSEMGQYAAERRVVAEKMV
ncbi:hypothetical protein PMIN06_000854 [Paraphaeosphaeria minitans]